MSTPNPRAFPCAADGRYDDCEFGMTLRDYFAAKAMVVIAQLVADRKHDLGREENRGAGIAREAYLLADAMLKARDA